MTSVGARWTRYSWPRKPQTRSAMRIRRLCAMRASAFALAFGLAVAPAVVRADTLLVGTRHVLKTPSAAARAARDGGVVEIEAGLYAGDAAVWTQNGLTLKAAGGKVHLRADGAQVEGKGM